MADWREKERKRDGRLCRRLLVALDAAQASPMGGVKGDVLVETIVAERGQGFEGEDHAIKLLRNLAAKGYLTLEDKRKRSTEMFCLKRLFAVILPKGSSLLNETIAADPEVEDERNLGEE